MTVDGSSFCWVVSQPLSCRRCFRLLKPLAVRNHRILSEENLASAPVFRQRSSRIVASSESVCSSSRASIWRKVESGVTRPCHVFIGRGRVSVFVARQRKRTCAMMLFFLIKVTSSKSRPSIRLRSRWGVFVVPDRGEVFNEENYTPPIDLLAGGLVHLVFVALLSFRKDSQLLIPIGLERVEPAQPRAGKLIRCARSIGSDRRRGDPGGACPPG